MQSISVLGLGIIGTPWAARYHAAGKLAGVWNRTAKPTATNWKDTALQAALAALAALEPLAAGAVPVDIPISRIKGNPFMIAGANDGAPRKDLKKPWAAVTRAAGLDGLRIHDLRHHAARVQVVELRVGGPFH